MRRAEEPMVIEVCHSFNVNTVHNSCTCPTVEYIPDDVLLIAKVKFGPHQFKCGGCGKCGVLEIDKKNKNKIIKGKCNEC